MLYIARIGHGQVMLAMVVELTNHLTCGRDILHKLNMHETHPRLYMYVGTSMTVSFFLLRIVWFTYAAIKSFILKYDEWRAPGVPLPIYISCTVFAFSGLALQYFWFSKIWAGLLKLLKKKSS